MKGVVLFIATFLSGIVSKSQSVSNRYPHGTLIVAVICFDGIILASDSRASFTAYNDILYKEIPYAYLDSNRKIYSLGKFQIGITGTENVGNTYWWDLVDKYNKSNKPDSSIENTFEKFKYYLQRKLKIPDSLLSGNVFILAGYENRNPVIMVIDSINTKSKAKSYSIKSRISSNNCIKQKLVLSDSEYYCKKIVSVLESGFRYCEEDWQLGIGGPLHIVKINQNNSIDVVKSFKFQRFKSYIDFQKSILNKKTKVTHFFPADTEKPFLEMLEKGIKNKM